MDELVQMSLHHGNSASPLCSFELNEDHLVKSKSFDYFENYLLLIAEAAAAVP